MAKTSPPLTNLADAEIVKKLKASDEAGLRALLEIHGQAVLDILTKKHGYHVAADAMNRAAMIIWLEMSAKYKDGEGTLRGWFLQIAHRKAIDIRRGEKLEKFVELDLEKDYDPTKCDDKAYQEEKAENLQKREQRNSETRRIVSELPRVQRIVTECDRDSAHDIAEVDIIRKALGNPNASNGSIDTARCKARATIRAEITRLGYDPANAGRRNHG
jgi:DNA-directed RNA polymerase specialized sigma24 family protein